MENNISRRSFIASSAALTGDAARMIGIDPHVREDNFKRYVQAGAFVHRPQALTALIMEATDGDLDEDFRMFVHSGVQAVSRTVNMLVKNGRLALPPGQHAYITHLGVKYRGWAAEQIEKEIPDTLRAAYDGLELVLG